MGKINEDNLWGKFMGKIYGENLWGKFMGKITYAVLATRPSCPGLATQPSCPGLAGPA